MQRPQEFLAGHAGDPVDGQSLLAQVKQTHRGFGIFLAEGAQRAQILAIHLAGAFDLDGPEHIRAINDEIHLAARLGAPEIELRAGCAVVDPGPQMLRDQALQGEAFDFLRPVQRPGGAQRAVNTGIEVEELVMGYKMPFRSAGEDRYAKRQ